MWVKMRRVSEVRYDVQLPDELFDPLKLPSASRHPIWAGSSE